MKKAFLLLAFSTLLLGCVQQGQQATTTTVIQLMKAQNGDLVAVDYVGKLDDGTVFDTSIRDEAVKAGLPLRSAYAPLEFTVGAGEMIAGFDKAVVGMSEGQEKTVRLSPSEAYGEKRADLIVQANKSDFPENIEIGMQTQSQSGRVGTITGVANDTVTVDFNHFLAGKHLTFKIIMKKIARN